MRLLFVRILTLFASLYVLSACQESSNTVMTESLSVSTCPKSGCIDPSLNESAVVLQVNESFMQKTTHNGRAGLDITGMCQTSLYKDNKIIISGTYVANNASAFTAFDTTKCINGRFHASLSLFSSSYKVKLSLHGIDDQGILHPATNNPLNNTGAISITVAPAVN